MYYEFTHQYSWFTIPSENHAKRKSGTVTETWQWVVRKKIGITLMIQSNQREKQEKLRSLISTNGT